MEEIFTTQDFLLVLYRLRSTVFFIQEREINKGQFSKSHYVTSTHAHGNFVNELFMFRVD